MELFFHSPIGLQGIKTENLFYFHLLPNTSKQTKILHHCPYIYVNTPYKLQVPDYDDSGLINIKTKSHKAEATLYYFSKNISLKSCILLNGLKEYKNSVNYTLYWRSCYSYIRSLHVHYKFVVHDRVKR
jgi:hypothetical protein